MRCPKIGCWPEIACGPEIACDESGYEGEKLVGGETDVFAHAGVRLGVVAAADCIIELRRRIRSPALEYKANHLLREKNRPVLLWLLGPQGPLQHGAQVQLVDKTFLLVRRIVDLLAGAGQDGRAEEMARTLYREGRLTSGPDGWAAFLGSANDLLRSRNQHAGIEAFHRTVDVLRAGVPGDAGDVLDRLRRAPLIDALTTPGLDPLVPAIVRAVLWWSDGGRVPVRIVHDRQTTLTEERIAAIAALAGGRVTAVRLVDSRTDPRVQVADFLAGVARKVASHELAGHGDAVLVALLRPYVDPLSVWGDDRSWSVLGVRAS